jgi:DNA-binding NtrC family response regulator
VARFLVVDNDVSAVRGMSQLLRGDGHEVAPFTAGTDAIKTMSEESFDAVVTDLEMPHVDGHAVVQAARQHQPGACLVVASAKAQENLKSLVEAGVCIVADKPFAYDEVTKAVCDCRARKGLGAHDRCHMRSRPHGHQLVTLRRK